MLEVQKSYQAMLRVLNGDRDFIDIANKNISSLPLKKQIECIVCALGEHAAKIREPVPSTPSNVLRVCEAAKRFAEGRAKRSIYSLLFVCTTFARLLSCIKRRIPSFNNDSNPKNHHISNKSKKGYRFKRHSPIVVTCQIILVFCLYFLCVKVIWPLATGKFDNFVVCRYSGIYVSGDCSQNDEDSHCRDSKDKHYTQKVWICRNIITGKTYRKYGNHYSLESCDECP